MRSREKEEEKKGRGREREDKGITRRRVKIWRIEGGDKRQEERKKETY
jgi:hypothetical protein